MIEYIVIMMIIIYIIRERERNVFIYAIAAQIANRDSPYSCNAVNVGRFCWRALDQFARASAVVCVCDLNYSGESMVITPLLLPPPSASNAKQEQFSTLTSFLGSQLVLFRGLFPSIFNSP